MEGDIPLTVEFDPVIVDGEAPYSFEWDFGDGFHSTAFSPTHTYTNYGNYLVRLRVTDNDGQVAYGGVIIKAFSTSLEPKDILWIKRLGIWGTEGFEKTQSGSEVFVTVSLENTGRDDLNDLKMVVTVPELGVRRSIGPFDLDKDETMSKSVYLPLPEAEAGEYDVRVIVGNEAIKRAKHRYMYIVE